MLMVGQITSINLKGHKLELSILMTQEGYLGAHLQMFSNRIADINHGHWYQRL